MNLCHDLNMYKMCMLYLIMFLLVTLYFQCLLLLISLIERHFIQKLYSKWYLNAIRVVVAGHWDYY